MDENTKSLEIVKYTEDGVTYVRMTEADFKKFVTEVVTMTLLTEAAAQDLENDEQRIS